MTLTLLLEFVTHIYNITMVAGNSQQGQQGCHGRHQAGRADSCTATGLGQHKLKLETETV